MRVVYSSLNFKDIMFTTGKLINHISGKQFQNMACGMEWVGFDANGQRVMGVCENK